MNKLHADRVAGLVAPCAGSVGAEGRTGRAAFRATHEEMVEIDPFPDHGFVHQAGEGSTCAAEGGGVASGNGVGSLRITELVIRRASRTTVISLLASAEGDEEARKG
jgi:hypothetical protein